MVDEYATQYPAPPALLPEDAHEYASWFRCLADGTRLLVAADSVTAGELLTTGGSPVGRMGRPSHEARGAGRWRS